MHRAFVITAAVAALNTPALAQHLGCGIIRESLATSGAEGRKDSYSPSLSQAGRFLAFQSASKSFHPGDMTAFHDVFVRDRLLGTTTRVSVSSAGVPGNDDSEFAWISADGGIVAFTSRATNFSTGDTNAARDVFLRDRAASTTTLISVSSAGVQGDRASRFPSLSDDGNLVLFESDATNLVPNDTNGAQDLFLRDVALGTTRRVSVSNLGAQANGDSRYGKLTGNGLFVVFGSRASNLGPADMNNQEDVYVMDLATGGVELISRNAAGNAGLLISTRPSISDDGQRVVFESLAPDLILGDTNGKNDVFLRDRAALTLERISVPVTSAKQANGHSSRGNISADGSRASFDSRASNLLPFHTAGSQDIFHLDLATGAMQVLTFNIAGQPASGGDSFGSVLSADGTRVAFASYGHDLVLGDTNGSADVFVSFCAPASVTYCSAKTNSLGCLPAVFESGVSSATASSGHVVGANQVRNNRPGLALHGVAGRNMLPFQGGFLCVATPVKRTPTVNAGGNPAPANDCSGVFSIDLNAFAAGALGGTPLAELRAPGTVVDVQWWGRDQGLPFPNNTTLSNGLEYVVGP